MLHRKSIVLLLLSFASIFMFVKLEQAHSDTQALPIPTGFFGVTAYYSPLPNQYKYTTGTYAGDVRLNGEGVNTASGMPVEVGIISAPKNYPFGTKIYLKGLGVGFVGDRGGAIVNSGLSGSNHDRLDIWAGYGDEGRERAKKWGRREVAGFIVDDEHDVTIEFEESSLFKEKYLEMEEPVPDSEPNSMNDTLSLPGDGVDKLKAEFITRLEELANTPEYADKKDELLDFAFRLLSGQNKTSGEDLLF